MLGLSADTEIQNPLPKVRLFEELSFTLKQRQKINRDIAKMTFTNVISPDTIPSLHEGRHVSAIYVVRVDLRGDDFDSGLLEKIAKSIPQHILYVLEHEGWSQLAVFNERLFVSEASPDEDQPPLRLEGRDLDSVWENLILNVGDFHLEEGNTLSEQIALNDQRQVLKERLEELQKRAYKTRQPHQKMELIQKIELLKKELP